MNSHSNDYREALRRSFLKVDESLNNGGLAEVAEMKRQFPPNKSKLMSMLMEAKLPNL